MDKKDIELYSGFIGTLCYIVTKHNCICKNGKLSDEKIIKGKIIWVGEKYLKIKIQEYDIFGISESYPFLINHNEIISITPIKDDIL